MVNNLSQLEENARPIGELDIEESFQDEHVLSASHDLIAWYANFSNFLVCEILLDDLNLHQKMKFLHDILKFYWDDLYLFWLYDDNVIRRCVPEF